MFDPPTIRPRLFEQDLAYALVSQCGLSLSHAERTAREAVEAYAPSYAVLRDYAEELAAEVSALRYDIASRDTRDG